MRVLVAVVVLSGCGVDYEHVSRRGRLCVTADVGRYPGSSEETFVIGERMTLWYTGNPHADGCEFDSHCEVRIGTNAHQLVVNAYLGWNEQPINCPRTIPQTTSTCETPMLSAGTYSIVWDDQRLELRVPSTTAEAPCIER